MDVTRSNFHSALPLIRDAVAGADFVSIDEELSGLRKGRGGDLFDLHADRYRKTRDACIGYSIIQFGLSCFRRRDRIPGKEPVFECRSFNIFIFPYKVHGLPRHLERNIEVQASAVFFLRSHGFDFNRLFDAGISYLTLREEQDCEQALRDNEDRVGQYSAVVPEELQDFVTEAVDQVDEFLADDSNGSSRRLDLAPCTAFKRKLLYQALSGDKYRTRLSIESLPVAPSSRDCFLSITRSDPQAKRDRAAAILTEASGFSRILRLLSECKKPIVGHNLFLDIMHLVAQFLTELPDSYDEFKQVVNGMFPQLYDTKYIASTLALKKIITSSALEDLWQTLTHEPFGQVTVDRICLSEETGDVHQEDRPDLKYHEAGYDSFITGHCFILMNNYLQATLSSPSEQSDEVIGSEVKRYVNRLNLTFSFDLDHYYFGGEEVHPQRDHVYHVSFPKDWNTQSISHLFAPYGAVQINWINDTSAFVGLKDASKARALNKSISIGKGTADLGVQITPYFEFRSRKEPEVTNRSGGKRSLDQNHVSDGGKERVIDEDEKQNKKKNDRACEESGKRVKRASSKESSAKKALQTPFQEEKDW